MSRLANTLERLGITAETEYGGNVADMPSGSRDMQGWRIRLQRIVPDEGQAGIGGPDSVHCLEVVSGPVKGQRSVRLTLSVDFFTGSACGEPTAADVLHCLLSDVRTFEDGPEALDDMGYNFSDGRKVWSALESIAPAVRAFLGEDFDTVERAGEDY